MAKKLERLLEEYLQLVERKYQATIMSKRKGILKLYSNRELEFSEFIIHTEKHTIFEQLVNETYKFKYSHYFEEKDSILDLSFDDLKRKIINYFRRSGCYYDIYINESVYSGSTLQKYVDALTRKEKEQYYFALMEYVGFAEHLMEFGQFRIQKFTADELDNMLNNKINKIFFTRSYLKMEQLKELEDYWFICLTKKSPVQGYRGHVWEIESGQDVTHTDIEFAQFPIEILPFIKILSLFDWQADSLKKIRREIDSIETSAIKFKIPFVFITDDDLLEPPKDAPDLSMLKTEQFTTWDNNKEDINVYEVPERNIILNKERTDYFINFINETNRLYSSIRIDENGWQFLNLSLDFFIKGFFSNGLEQLLWNIISIEALLGGENGGYEWKNKDGDLKKEGLTEKLSRRIALILANEPEHQKGIKREFKELYDFRCDLVHGNRFEKKVLIKHLLNTINISRKTILWFIYALNEIQNVLSEEKKEPRESILDKIDINMIKDFPIMPYI